MQNFQNRLEPLIELWEEWNDVNEDVNDDSWQPVMLTLEKNIFSEVQLIIDEYTNNVDFPTKIPLDEDEDILTIIFHIVLSIDNGSIYDKQLIHIDYIENLLNNTDENYYDAIGSAVNYLDTKSQEIVIEKMLESPNLFSQIKAIQIIVNAKLIIFNSHCVSLLSSIAKRGYSENDQYLLLPLLEASYTLRINKTVRILETLLNSKSLQQEFYDWQETLLAAVRLDSIAGWRTFREKCIARQLSPQVISVMGKFGKKHTKEFIIEQLESEEAELDWIEAFLNTLGDLGDPSSLTTIINYIDHEELDIVETCLESFFAITGARLDDELDFDANYCFDGERNCKEILSKWIESKADNFTPNTRYDAGRPFNFQQLVDNLLSPGYGARWSSSANLSIYTNHVIPYNPDGFVHSMIESQKNWQIWLDEHMNRYPAGRWYMDGKEG